MNAEQHRQLDQDGYVLLKRVIDQAHVERLITRLETLWTEERELAGVENYIEQNARRLANLANKGEIFRAVMRHPEVLEVVSAVIGPDIRINMLNAREVPPHSDP